MAHALRVVALVLALGFLVVGTVWAYFIAVVGWFMGGGSWLAMVGVARLEAANGRAPTRVTQVFDRGVRVLLGLAGLVSLGVLVALLVAG